MSGFISVYFQERAKKLKLESLCCTIVGSDSERATKLSFNNMHYDVPSAHKGNSN